MSPLGRGSKLCSLQAKALRASSAPLRSGRTGESLLGVGWAATMAGRTRVDRIERDEAGDHGAGVEGVEWRRTQRFQG